MLPASETETDTDTVTDTVTASSVTPVRRSTNAAAGLRQRWFNNATAG